MFPFRFSSIKDFIFYVLISFWLQINEKSVSFNFNFDELILYVWVLIIFYVGSWIQLN